MNHILYFFVFFFLLLFFSFFDILPHVFPHLSYFINLRTYREVELAMKLIYIINHASSVQPSTSKIFFGFFQKLRNKLSFHKSIASLFQVTWSNLYFVKSRGNPVRVANVVIVAIAVRVHIAKIFAIVVIRRTKPPPEHNLS